MHTNTKKGLLLFLMVVLLLPFADHCINFIHSGDLSGAYNLAPDAEFSIENWWSGTFQDKKNKYDNDHTGFRPDLVRLNNQIDYSLFKKLHFQWGEMGKNGCVWDGLYIDAYLGIDYIGRNKILTQLCKLKKVQDALAALGKTIVLIQAPCKGFYYPDCFPEEYNEKKKGPTNLETYSSLADSLGVNQINFNSWFVKLKDTSKAVLYPKQGIHWSLYGAALAADSFVKYMGVKHHINMQPVKWLSLMQEKTARETDDDIGRQLNLIVPISNEVYTYPEIDYRGDKTKQKPKAIYIGDSFLCQWYFYHFYDYLNSDWHIWFYFNTVCDLKYPYGTENGLHVKELNWMDEILKTDYVVLMYTAKNLPALGDGFIEQSYGYFYPEQ